MKRKSLEDTQQHSVFSSDVMYIFRKTSVDTACTVIYRPATITEDSNVAIKTENGEICEQDADTADSNNEKDTPRGRGKTN